jgi:hypothetical protein
MSILLFIVLIFVIFGWIKMLLKFLFSGKKYSFITLILLIYGVLAVIYDF